MSDEINQMNHKNEFEQDQGSSLREKMQMFVTVTSNFGTIKLKDERDAAITYINFSRICSICLKTEYEFGDNDPVPSWKNCPTCLFGWCCSEDHWKQYKARHSPGICAAYRASSEIDRFRYNYMKNHNEYFTDAPELIRSEPMEYFPSDWEEYFQVRSPEEAALASAGRLPQCYLPAATKELGQPATCLYGMYFHDQTHFCAANELTIHVVGASPNLELPTSYVWEEILHVLPKCKTLHISFIGPDIDIAAGMEEDLNQGTAMEVCPDCQ
jgi:hypothetical protein